MNLYQLHNQPDKLAGAGVADEKIPKLVWDKYRANYEERWKRRALFKDLVAQRRILENERLHELAKQLTQNGIFVVHPDFVLFKLNNLELDKNKYLIGKLKRDKNDFVSEIFVVAGPTDLSSAKKFATEHEHDPVSKFEHMRKIYHLR